MSLRPIVLSALLAISAPAWASRGDTCPAETDRAQIHAFRDRLAAAESPEAARELALDQTRLGHLAITRAAKALPDNRELAAAEERLSAFEADIDDAATQAEVAARFDALMAAPTIGGNCDYTGVEVVIIVIGFVLGIIPGIIFLFLLC